LAGLSKSFVDEKGFTWDVGGHVQFSHYKYFDELMLKALGEDGWLTHQRESWVWIENRFVPYPFQNNIKYLTPETMWKCLEGIIHNYKFPTNQKPANFREWILATFGSGLAETFMFPLQLQSVGLSARRYERRLGWRTRSRNGFATCYEKHNLRSGRFLMGAQQYVPVS
jgi:protoporphyrinogen oxidase